ncbi:MAG: ABC transporter permease [Phycisphaerales bacterium]|nr:ABC transporter permease [Phycisphaerales bacterium]
MSSASAMSSELRVLRARGEPLWRHADPRRMLAGLWSYRGLIWQMTRRDVQARHRGSHLGGLWTLLTPMLLLGVYTLVFSTILRVRFERSASAGVGTYAVTLFTSMMVYAMFAEPLSRAPMLVAARPNFVKKMVFPLEILPVCALLGAMGVSLAALAVTLGVHLVMGGGATPWMLAFPAVLVPLVLVSLGAGWILATLGVFVQDLQQLSAVIMQRVLFFLTPIFYPPENVPEQFRWMLHINPMSAVVEGGRRTLLWGEAPDWTALGIWSAIGAGMCIGGYACFMKARRGFADVM